MEQTNGEPVKVEVVCETAAPPTWEDVMNEKKSELQMQTNHLKTGRESSDFIQLEKREIDKEAAKEEETIKVENDEKVTCIQNFLATLQRIINILKAIAMWCTLMSDVALLISSLGVLIICCLIEEQYFEVTRVIYRQEFKKGGEAFLAFSCINLFICCPLGILGTYKKRRRLLKWHNVILLINGLAHTLAVAVLFLRYIKKEKKHRLESVYLKTMRDTYKYCEVKQINKTEECCCWLKTTRKAIICSPFQNPIDESLGPRGSSCTDKEDYFARSDMAIDIVFNLLLLFVLIEATTFFFGYIAMLTLPPPCKEPDDLEDSDEHLVRAPTKRTKEKKRMNVFKKALIFFVARYIFWLVLLGLYTTGFYAVKAIAREQYLEIPVQGGSPAKINLWDLMMSTCVCGTIQSLLLKSEEAEEKKRRKRRKPPKGRVAKFYRKAKYMACKKILIAIFGVVLVISWPLFNLWYKGFIVKIDKIEVNIIDLISYQFNSYIAKN